MKLGCDDDDENEVPRGNSGDKPTSPLSEVAVVLLPPEALRSLVSKSPSAINMHQSYSHGIPYHKSSPFCICRI